MNPPEEATPRTDAVMDEDDLATAVGQYRIDHPEAAPELEPDTRCPQCGTVHPLLAQLRRQVAEGQAYAMQACVVNPVCNCVCDRGVKCCTVDHNGHDAITSALAAERAATIEQCAKVAAPYHYSVDGRGCENFCITCRDRRRIMDAIRALGNTDGGSNETEL